MLRTVQKQYRHMLKVLVVDDEIDIRELVAEILRDEGYDVEVASTASKAIEKANSSEFGVVLLDIWLEGSDMDGIGVLKSVKSINPNIPVIMISGHGNIETAVQCIKLGAYDFIEKPFQPNKLIIMVERAATMFKLMHENSMLKRHVYSGFELEGSSKNMQSIAKEVKSAASVSSRIIITGEDGTGKEYIANLIHNLSSRKNRNFIVLNAAELDDGNFDALMFGTREKVGIMQRCAGGTLFIAELTGLKPSIQQRFLNIVQESLNDVRFIAASSKDIQKAVSEKEFNPSLYYRLNVLPIKVEPLRKRKDDIPILIKKFLAHLTETLKKPEVQFSDAAISVLQRYEWPGNIRQLKNVIEWIVIMKSQNAKIIDVEDLPAEILGKGSESKEASWFDHAMLMPLKEARDEFERQYIRNQVEKYGGNISKTAEHLHIDRAALHRKMKALNLKKDLKGD